MLLEQFIWFVIVVVIIGLFVYLVERFAPLTPELRVVLRVVALLIVLIWLLDTVRGAWPLFPRR